MKKLVLIALVASFATAAFAQNGKGMVEANNCFEGNRCDSLDLRIAGDDEDNAELEAQTIALNYNYLFTNNFGAGLSYATRTSTVDGDVIEVGEANSDTIGVNLFWNFDGGWESGYAALRYDVTTFEDEDATADSGREDTTITLEAGKRMKMGKIFGLALLYSPSVSYAMTTEVANDSTVDDIESTELRLNVANFAVTF